MTSEVVKTWAARLDAWLRTWGPLLLLVFAVCYYAQYYRSGLNLGGEGGTVAVNAMRLNEGWLPIKDTTLNYNVLWFYPVAWLFKVTGPDYVALRIYFFVLCSLSGLLAFLIVRRATGRGWLAVGTGALVLLIPGMLFRNYMGLLTLLNAWALLHAFGWEARRPGWRWLRFAVAGIALGVTFLVRVELGLFFLVIGIGLAVIYPLAERGEFRRRWPVALGGCALAALAALAIHAPFYVDAERRGFGPEFVDQYARIWNYLKYEAQRNLPGRPAAATPIGDDASTHGVMPVRFKPTRKGWADEILAAQAKREIEGRHGRARPSLRDLGKPGAFYDRAFVLILYLPILIAGMIFAGAGGVLLAAIVTRNCSLKEPALVCLVTLGSALTLFPQYFFFRPDTPHLSEFMVPFLVAMVCASFHAWRRAASTGSWFIRGGGFAFVALCVGAQGLYCYHSFPKESAGTIAANRKRSHEVIAANGVRVWVKRREQPWLQELHDTIVRCSAPDDWVITYPYSPTINFMTNRRSYLKDLYIDNATAERNFPQRTVAELERFRPAVIVIDQRDINDTEFSRFKNWAAPTYAYIRSHYVLAGIFDENEVYVRRDKFPAHT